MTHTEIWLVLPTLGHQKSTVWIWVSYQTIRMTWVGGWLAQNNSHYRRWLTIVRTVHYYRLLSSLNWGIRRGGREVGCGLAVRMWRVFGWTCARDWDRVAKWPITVRCGWEICWREIEWMKTWMCIAILFGPQSRWKIKICTRKRKLESY